MTPATIAIALGGHRAGREWMAPCPAHQDDDPSLSIGIGRNGKILIYCHAGCSQPDVIAALRERGLWEDSMGAKCTPVRVPSQLDKAHLTELALRIWRQGSPIEGSLAETYLASRGLSPPTSDALRFHVGLRHRSGNAHPAMIAMVKHGTSGVPLGILRTYLAADVGGKATVEPARMMLGPCRGGAVQLATVDDNATLVVGEGVETVAAAMQATGHAGWAALSTSGLRTLDLPYAIRNVVVLADGGDPGEAAASAAAQRWAREGRSVRIARAPPDSDFNDLLIAPHIQFGGMP